jgi:hypothetical protein
MCHCGARLKLLVLSFKQRSVSWENLLILNPQRHIHKRWWQAFLKKYGFQIRSNNSWIIVVGRKTYSTKMETCLHQGY